MKLTGQPELKQKTGDGRYFKNRIETAVFQKPEPKMKIHSAHH